MRSCANTPTPHEQISKIPWTAICVAALVTDPFSMPLRLWVYASYGILFDNTNLVQCPLSSAVITEIVRSKNNSKPHTSRAVKCRINTANRRRSRVNSSVPPVASRATAARYFYCSLYYYHSTNSANRPLRRKRTNSKTKCCTTSQRHKQRHWVNQSSRHNWRNTTLSHCAFKARTARGIDLSISKSCCSWRFVFIFDTSMASN